MRTTALGLFIVLAILNCRAGEEAPAANEPVIVYGSSGELGEGTSRTYAEFDAEGNPVAIGLSFTEGFLKGLPTELNPESVCFDLNEDGSTSPADGECLGDYATDYDLPTDLTERDDIPFRWVGAGLEPMGHEPPGVWDIPHFDFHFYLQPREEVHAIRPGPCGILIDCEDFERATATVPSQYVAEGYNDVQVAVPAMGNHLINPTSPEFGDPPQRFTHTFIYGAYDGHITFLEPMITVEYLESRPNECHPIKQPVSWEESGYYPREYCARYLEDEGTYRISLEDFAYHEAE
ncbi:MAG: hypothetical protein KAI97_01900 [Gemmatimonadetes bacterium]|nr:hypothetical protein [Gemmatimonadota bacterium]